MTSRISWRMKKVVRVVMQWVNTQHQSLITRFLSQRQPAKEDKQREIEVDEEIDDIGEMPEDSDFAGFDEVLEEVGEPGVSGQHGDGEGNGAKEGEQGFDTVA